MSIVELGLYCKNFRINILKMTLKEVAKETNVKTLSGFEHGRSKNIMHVFKYIDVCTNRNERIIFMQGLCELLEGVYNE